ncbi:hypothetical protein M758_4G252100 [Ceratodon purpureus]|nr:hypothetical protein M758_4G252100 [Ceratodon purpureus]
MTTLAPILTSDIPSILANSKLDMEPITIAAVFNPDGPIIVDDDAIIEFDAPISESLPLLQPHRQVERDTKAIANTRVDWRETPTTHIFQVDLPGVKKEDIKLQIIEGTTLEICGNRGKEEVRNIDKWHIVERTFGNFLRRFRLPQNANSEEIKASVENGVLTITISKHKKPEPNIQRINIS